MVYEMTKSTISFIKANLPSTIKRVHYFSDGFAGQYKNYKNYLCFHEADFGMNCTWSFFATSHGKSPCDGTGGTVKHLTTRASLQTPNQNWRSVSQIMFYAYMTTNIGLVWWMNWTVNNMMYMYVKFMHPHYPARSYKCLAVRGWWMLICMGCIHVSYVH